MRRLVIAISLGAAVAAAGAADKYSADWMTYGAGARALGMGGAFVAVADDATAPYWNPAGMPAVEGAAFSAMHSYTFNGLATYDSVFGAYNLGDVGTAGRACATRSGPGAPWRTPRVYRRPGPGPMPLCR